MISQSPSSPHQICSMFGCLSPFWLEKTHTHHCIPMISPRHLHHIPIKSHEILLKYAPWSPVESPMISPRPGRPPGLDRVDPLEYVFRRSWRWGNHHLISLAHHLECILEKLSAGFDMGILSIEHGESKPRNMEIYIIGIYIIGIEATKNVI